MGEELFTRETDEAGAAEAAREEAAPDEAGAARDDWPEEAQARPDGDEPAPLAAGPQAEAAFQQRLQAEQDRLVAQIYEGQVNPYTGRPIATKAEYDAFARQYGQERQRERAGDRPDRIGHEPGEDPAARQARDAVGRRALEEQIAEIGRIDPSVRSMADLIAMPSFREFDAKVRQGYRLADAFKLANFDTLGRKRSAAAKQAALNALSGKRHLTATAGGAGEDVIVPAETMQLYRQMFPGWTDARIIKDYKKHR